MKIFRLLSVPMLLAASHGSAKADVTLGSSTARDITSTATITGNLGLASIGTNNITAGPVNEADGTAFPPYHIDPVLFGTAGANTGLGLLGITGETLDLLASSDVDGTPGPKSALGFGVVTTASSTFGLGVLDLSQLLAVSIQDDPMTAAVLTSTSAVIGDHGTLSPFSTSNFLSSHTTVIITVLGVQHVIPALQAGEASRISVLADNAFANITGDIFLTPDLSSTGFSGNSAFSSATGLRVTADLFVDAISGGDPTTFTVKAETLFNFTSARLTAVPEVSSPLLCSMALLACLGRRQRG